MLAGRLFHARATVTRQANTDKINSAMRWQNRHNHVCTMMTKSVNEATKLFTLVLLSSKFKTCYYCTVYMFFYSFVSGHQVAELVATWSGMVTDQLFDPVPALPNDTYKGLCLTPSLPAVPCCCCSKGSAPYWSNPLFVNFWHLGALALSPKRQSARMSKIIQW